MDAIVAAATSFPDLILTIPPPYRSALKGYLSRKYRIARNCVYIRRELASYQGHNECRTFPSSIRAAVKVPYLNPADEFLQSSEYAANNAAIHLEAIRCRAKLLRRAIAQKTAELVFLSSRARADDDRDWNIIVDNVAFALAGAYGGTLVTDTSGCLHLRGVSLAASADFYAIRGAYRLYSARILSIARVAH